MGFCPACSPWNTKVLSSSFLFVCLHGSFRCTLWWSRYKIEVMRDRTLDVCKKFASGFSSCRSSRWIQHEIVQWSNCLPPRNSDEYFTCENGCCLEKCLSYLHIYAGCCCGNLDAIYFHKLCVFFPSLKNTARIMVRSLSSSSFWLLFNNTHVSFKGEKIKFC